MASYLFYRTLSAAALDALPQSTVVYTLVLRYFEPSLTLVGLDRH